ncbi:MAG: MarC family protein [Crenarchaeota archaeon]|nr:MarC family protein [Thermoproteota archaeon]
MPLAGGDAGDLVRAVLLLFIAVDPLGNAPLFYAITSAMSSEERRRIVSRSIKVALLILASFALAGDTLLHYFGLTIADLRIAGGVILFIYGVIGILGHTEATMLRSPAEAESLAIVPLATPLLAGPAAIATVVYIKAVAGLHTALASIAFITALTYITLYYSDKLMEKMGENGSIALSKIMSILLAAIAVAMIRTGIEEAIRAIRAEGQVSG